MTAHTHPHIAATAARLTIAACTACFGLAAQAGNDMAERAHALTAEQASTARPFSAADAALTLRSEDSFVFTDGAATTSRADLRYNEATGWLSPDKPSSLGLSLGVLSAPAARGTQSAPLAYDLGLRWRSRLQQRVHLDVQAWTRSPQQFAAHDAMGMIWAREPAQIGTRLEVQWKASRTGGLVPEFGAIGVQLQGDAKLLLRARHGGPMVYYRAKF